ncbi:guanylate kinase, partial [candidate division KSB1 bacterium]|nr:guanylate kinase [candidate division KSB1 bacterium]
MSGLLIVFSAPSGAGKTTIIDYLLKNFPDEFYYSISATTRKPRTGEINGNDYFFLSEEEFKKKIEQNEFVEWEIVHENYYGTLKSRVEPLLHAGKNIVFDIDVKGGLKIKSTYPFNSISIFITAPSIDMIIDRLRKRGTENDAEINKRIARYSIELEQSKYFDFIVINETVEKAVEQI